MSPFVFALHVTHHVLRAYSHAAFALGVAYDTRPPECMETVGMFVNTVLVPFGAAAEPIEEVQRRWVQELLPRARTPYDAVVRAIGGEANTYLAFNVGFGGDGGAEESMRELEPAEENGDAGAKFDLSFGWADAPDGGWGIDIESGIGVWPRIDERIRACGGGAAGGR